MSLSPVDPITISEDRQQITLRLRDGSSVSQKISPTPKVKREKLAEALASLLSRHEPDPKTNPPSPATPTLPSFGTLHWELDPEGDAIHRHIASSSAEEVDGVIEAVMAEAETMNHHPHIARTGEDGTPGGNCVTITCTTHSPRGLSARDTRLATKIDELLAGFEVMQRVKPSSVEQDPEQLRQHIDAMREHNVAANRQKILQALESCNCATSKS